VPHSCVVGFRERSTGLNYATRGADKHREPATDEHGNPLAGVTGSGSEVHLDVLGTGFLVSDKGPDPHQSSRLNLGGDNDDLKEMTDQGVDPVVIEMTAYFPASATGSHDYRKNFDGCGFSAPEGPTFQDRKSKRSLLPKVIARPSSGGPVVLLGYPRGSMQFLLRSGEETIRSIATEPKASRKRWWKNLPRRHLIRPVVTQGHIGDVLPDKIHLRCQTSSAALVVLFFNSEGKVIGINFAMVRDFGGANSPSQ